MKPPGFPLAPGSGHVHEQGTSMRIVSLCPSTTETVCALGRGADLVGITKFCVHPRGALSNIPRVGGTKNPDIERLVALKPDLVLMNREENRREDAERLSARGLRIHACMPQSVKEAAEAVRALGRELHAAQPARQLAARIDELAAEVQREARGRRPLGVAYLIWRKPWMAAGSPTYIDDLLALAGGRNLFAELGERYPVVEVARLAAAELVLLASEPFPFKERHVGELAGLTGLEPQRFVLVDGESFSWHGYRTLNGLRGAQLLFRERQTHSHI